MKLRGPEENPVDGATGVLYTHCSVDGIRDLRHP